MTEEKKTCVKCHLEKNTKFYGYKCSDCYNKERLVYYYIKKKNIPDLIFIHNAINTLNCCQFVNIIGHKERINNIINELENIINYYC